MMETQSGSQDLLNELNPEQRKAVETPQGPLLIIAGPGSGKTRVIVHRIAYLVKSGGIPPQRIMAVTFTNKAAREMKERLQGLLGEAAERLTVGTFHAICARFLRYEGKSIGLDPSFVIYDEEDQRKVLERVLEDLRIDSKQYPLARFHSAIEEAKSRLLLPQDYSHHRPGYWGEVVRRVYERYQQVLSESKALDFDDLIMKAVLLFRGHPAVLEKYQSRYLHLLVDEFQDTNVAQYLLAKQLAGKHRNICVVGDPDQSIYSWRFADLRHVLNFEKDYPDARVVFLEQNYRSTQVILEAAQRVISANRQRKEKKLWTGNERGVPVTVVKTFTEQEEAQFVVSEVEQLASRGEIAPGDCVVMYRTHAQSRPIEEIFVRYGVPYKLIGGVRFYQRREVKDIIAYLRVIQNPQDSLSLGRIIPIPRRGIGERSVAELSRWAKSLEVSPYEALRRVAAHSSGEPPASSFPFSSQAAQRLRKFFSLMEEFRAKAKEGNVAELLRLVLERTGYQEYVLAGKDGEERWNNVQELCTVAEESGESLESFLERVSLMSEVDALEENSGAVPLITLHQAKGLEFPVVFMVGMEENLLPHIKSIKLCEEKHDLSQLEEERRLCYVGMTRAQKRLYLVYCSYRSFAGRSGVAEPSRFLEDIPSRLVVRRNGIRV